MINNKKHFDVITPLSDFHRKSRVIATKVSASDGTHEAAYEIDSVIPGEWVQNTQNGITKKDATYNDGTNDVKVPGLSMLCLNVIKNDNPYEAMDTKGGYVTVVNTPGILVQAGPYYFAGDAMIDPATGGFTPTITPGWRLSVRSDGKLQRTSDTSGETLSNDNAVVTAVDQDGAWVEYMIMDSYATI